MRKTLLVFGTLLVLVVAFLPSPTVASDNATVNLTVRVLGESNGWHGHGGGGIDSQYPEPESLEIISVDVSNVRDKTATITWYTNKPCYGKVRYWASSNKWTLWNTERKSSCSIVLDKLEADTEYHFRVLLREGYTVEVVSKEYDFTTLPLSIVDEDIADNAGDDGALPADTDSTPPKSGDAPTTKKVNWDLVLIFAVIGAGIVSVFGYLKWRQRKKRLELGKIGTANK